MTRETENTVLLLVGLSIGMITFSGAFTRYVKPSLLPWLVVTAVLLIGLALVAIVGDIRRGGPGHGGDHDQDHDHRTGVVWLLIVPIVVLIFVTPPALRPQAAARSTTASNGTQRRAFPPLPSGHAPEVPLPEVLMRAANDTSGSLTNRLITIRGFVLNERGGMDLARIVIICCAADAQLARIHLRGGAATGFGDNTWLRVEGRVQNGTPIPTFDVVTVTRIDTPPTPYA
jgi:uncharacterized repeat protein (TIGR03943 family)